jgi:hypothetical protein
VSIATSIPNRRSTLPPAQKTRATAEAGSKESHFYQPLATEFRRDGFRYTQIVREDDAAIYEQLWTGCAEPTRAYEVIRIRRRTGFQIGGRLVQPAEVYPNAEAWGSDGFTVLNRDGAFSKLRDLVSFSAAICRRTRDRSGV